MLYGQPLVIAHRGSSGNAPENTLVSFRKAIEMGADFIELDIHLSKDGELIVMHDETVNRTTNGKGKIRELTLAEIKGLDAGSWFNEEFKGVVVPTLGEVLELTKLVSTSKTKEGFPRLCKILIEVKGTSQKYPGIEKKLLDLLINNNSLSQCIIQSFDPGILGQLNKLDSSLNLHLLVIGGLFPKKIPSYIKAINPNFHFATEKKINKLHLQNRKIFVWTVNEEKKMKKMIEAGVDGVISNYPERLIKLIKKEKN